MRKVLSAKGRARAKCSALPKTGNPPTRRTVGVIRAEGMALDGCRVRIVETSRNGLELLAEVLESRPGWAVGDRVKIGAAEFIQG